MVFTPLKILRCYKISCVRYADDDGAVSTYCTYGDVLKEWGYEGVIMSDWTGTYSTVEAIKAGLDLEMP